MLIGSKIYYYKKVTSTNDVALRLAKQGRRDGAVVLAEYQSNGRGRSGRKWLSPAGKSISAVATLSLLLRMMA